jgi:DNA repair exonuclease SbcCD ATPase subunit
VQLNEKMQQIKNAVSLKIKQELDESERLRGLLSQSTTENESLMGQVQELSAILASNSTPDDSKQEIEYLHSKTSELVTNLQKSEAELTRLRQYLVEVEESSTQEILTMQSTVNEYQLQVQTLERERDEWLTVNQQDSQQRLMEQERLEQNRAEIANSMQKLNQAMRKQEQDQQMILNLQSVLAQFENCRIYAYVAKEKDIEEALGELQAKVDKQEVELISYQQENFELKSKWEEFTHLQSNTFQMEKELEKKSELIGQLRHDVAQLQSHLSEAMRFMKKGNSEDSVDKKLIANLFIGYVLLSHGDPKRYEILNLIASILKLSDEEKQKMGLIRQSDSSATKVNSPTQGEVMYIDIEFHRYVDYIP